MKKPAKKNLVNLSPRYNKRMKIEIFGIPDIGCLSHWLADFCAEKKIIFFSLYKNANAVSPGSFLLQKI